MKHNLRRFAGCFALSLVLLPGLSFIAFADGDLNRILTTVSQLENFAVRGEDWPGDLLYYECPLVYVAMNPPRRTSTYTIMRSYTNYPGFLNVALLYPSMHPLENWNGIYPMELHVSFWPQGSSTNQVFWESVYGRWNEYVYDYWRGQHAPIFVQYQSLPRSQQTDVTHWWRSLNPGVNECWEFAGESTSLQRQLYSITFQFVVAVYRYGYQSGDDWTYCTVSAYRSYLNQHYQDYPGTDFPYINETLSELDSLPSSVSVPVIFENSKIDYLLKQRIRTTNTFTNGWWAE